MRGLPSARVVRVTWQRQPAYPTAVTLGLCGFDQLGTQVLIDAIESRNCGAENVTFRRVEHAITDNLHGRAHASDAVAELMGEFPRRLTKTGCLVDLIMTNHGTTH